MATVTDITTTLYQVPATETAQMYEILDRPEITTLTSGVVNGTGVFDALMASLKAHLRAEYDASRITGAEYTKAYIELTQGALSAAVQFALGRDAAFWAAQKAQVEAVTGRVALESAKYSFTNILPAQLKLVQEQAEVQRAQTMDTRSDGTPVTGVSRRQRDLYEQQIVSYKRDSEVKAGKLFTDAWTVQKTIDEGLVAPNGFTNASLDTVLTAIKLNNGLS